MIINLELMKEQLKNKKSNCSSWITSGDGSYEACLHDKGYYKLQKDIKLVERLDEIEVIMDNLMDEHDAILEKLGEDLR